MPELADEKPPISVRTIAAFILLFSGIVFIVLDQFDAVLFQVDLDFWWPGIAFVGIAVYFFFGLEILPGLIGGKDKVKKDE